MWQNLSYPKKIYAITGGFIIIMLLAYVIVFSRTFALFKETKQKTEKLAWLKEKEKEIPLLQSQMALLDKAYNSSDSSSIRDQLTAFISDFAEQHECMVTAIPEKSLYASSQLNVQTNKFVIRGKYNQLLQLLNAVETNYNYTAKVVSAKYYSVKDLQTKQTNLYLAMITQSFRQHEPIKTH
jgi:5-methylcytosine-specific restriction endonuclease McrBC GTP-binding regulatory subunit McrB